MIFFGISVPQGFLHFLNGGESVQMPASRSSLQIVVPPHKLICAPPTLCTLRMAEKAEKFIFRRPKLQLIVPCLGPLNGLNNCVSLFWLHLLGFKVTQNLGKRSLPAGVIKMATFLGILDLGFFLTANISGGSNRSFFSCAFHRGKTLTYGASSSSLLPNTGASTVPVANVVS